MRNCLILSSRRSVTIIVTGTLLKSGYFIGEERLYPPRESNPKGFLRIQKLTESMNLESYTTTTLCPQVLLIN